MRNATVLAAVTALVLATPSPAQAADPARDQQWALDRIGATAAHDVGRGAGVVIAVVDSGVDLGHEDLAGNLVAGYDVVDGDRTPQDEFGHGTHVAGIAAAAAGNGRGIEGVAPAASIMPVRVLDEDGRGSSADVEEGIAWAVANGADVVNLSLGQAAQQVFGSSLVDAIRDAWAAGVVVVVAAGNEYVLGSGFDDEPALVVSATTRNDREPDYSNGVGAAQWGMAAPGGGCQVVLCGSEDGVLSTYWVEGRSDQYARLSGTSMAAPHVAGAAAVLLGLGLSPQQVVDRLLDTAHDLGPSGRDSTYGAGRLDLAAAVAGLGGGDAPAPAAEEPTPSQRAQPDMEQPPATAPPSPSPAPTSAATPTTPTTPSAAPSPSPPPATQAPSPAPAPTAADAADEVATTAPGAAEDGPDRRLGPAVLLLVAAAVAVALAWRRDAAGR